MRPVHLVLVIAIGSAWLACGSDERSASQTPTPTTPPVAAPAPAAEFRVEQVQLGREIGDDKRVSSPATSFAPTDTIYAAVESDGAAPAVVLTARWTYEDGQLVSESTETIAPNGPAVTEFHIAKPAGWPTGKYTVQIIADGRQAAEREFEVR